MIPNQMTDHRHYQGIHQKWKILHQVIKLARQNNLKIFKDFLKTDSKLAVDDNLVLKSNQIVIPSDLQNHVISLAH